MRIDVAHSKRFFSIHKRCLQSLSRELSLSRADAARPISDAQFVERAAPAVQVNAAKLRVLGKCSEGIRFPREREKNGTGNL